MPERVAACDKDVLRCHDGSVNTQEMHKMPEGTGDRHWWKKYTLGTVITCLHLQCSYKVLVSLPSQV